MTPDPSNPLRRRFRKDGPNYAPSGLDSPVRQAERAHVDDRLNHELILLSCMICGITGGASISLLMPWDRERAMEVMEAAFSNQPTSGFRDEPGAGAGVPVPGSVGT